MENRARPALALVPARARPVLRTPHISAASRRLRRRRLARRRRPEIHPGSSCPRPPASRLAARASLRPQRPPSLDGRPASARVRGPRLFTNRLARALLGRSLLPARLIGASPQSVRETIGKRKTRRGRIPAPTHQHLARVSGRTGRVVWDIPLEEQPSEPEPGEPRPPKLDDIDGDGSLDAALFVRGPTQPAQSEYELKVISLHDGVSRWSRVIRYNGFVSESPSIEIARRARMGLRRSSSRNHRRHPPATSCSCTP